jgi:hypothetical protein
VIKKEREECECEWKSKEKIFGRMKSEDFIGELIIALESGQ